MLVELRAARAAAEVEHALHVLDSLVDHPGDGVRRLQRRARRQEHVDLHAALVERRQKVAAELGHHADAHGHRSRHRDQDRGRITHAQPDRPARQRLEDPQQQPVGVVVHELRAGQQPVRQHGSHGQRHHQRRENGDDVGNPQRREEFAFHAFQREERHEHQDHEDRAEHDRVPHLAARLVDHPQRRLRLRQLVVLPESTEDVFDIDDRVIHEFADCHREPPQRHRVDRHAQPFEDQARDHDGERNGGECDECRAEIEQEEKQHEHYEHAAVTERLDHVPDAQIDEGLLLIQLRIDLNIVGERWTQLFDRLRDGIGQPPRVGAGLLGDHEHDGGNAIDGRVAPLDLRRLGHAGHLPEHHRPVAGGLDDHRRQITHRLDPAERSHEQFVAPLVQVAAGGVGIARLYGRLHLREADAILQEQRRIDEHLELLPSAPHRDDLRDAGDRQQPLPHHPVGQRADLDRRRGPRLAVHPHMHDLPHDRRDRGELRPNALGHAIEGHGDLLGHDLPVHIDVGSPAKLDVDHRQADTRRAPHRLHACGPIEDRLEGKRDQCLDLLGREARRLGHDGHPRPIQVGKDVDRQPGERVAAVHHHSDRHDDREQAEAEGVFDDCVEHESPGLIA